MHRCASFSAAFIIATALLHPPVPAHAQAYQGYTLYSAFDSRDTYLVDMNNRPVHHWSHALVGGYSCYLMPDGTLLRPAKSTSPYLNGGAAAGIVQRIAWDGTVLWEFTYSTSAHRTHHDIEPLPNGNILCIAWELKTAQECVQAGLDHSSLLWPDHIIEVQPVGSSGGNIVWEWHVWDHLIQDYNPSKSNYGVVGDHPELLDINIESNYGDWLHTNAVSYNPDLDQIAFTSHYTDELYVIDHSTTTAQAAGHTGGNSGKGGDFLYRWGRPGNYRAPGAKVFDVVHCAWWIPAGLPGAGNIMAFNNRETGTTSEVVEITPPAGYALAPSSAWGPLYPTWSFTDSWFWSSHLGSCQRLPNGNTLMAESHFGNLYEVNAAGVVQWSYSPGGMIPRALRYDPSYPGLGALFPVRLASFTARRDGRRVLLDWRTETETDNYGFEIERSIAPNGAPQDAWQVVAFIPGAGTTAEARSYAHADPIDPGRLAGSTVSYRLWQIDTDGKRSCSSVADLRIEAAGFALDPAFPNPCASTATVAFSLPGETRVRLEVFDALERRVAVLCDGLVAAGSHAARFDASPLPAGAYVCRLIAGGAVIERRIAVVR
jgi:hypothetical protein